MIIGNGLAFCEDGVLRERALVVNGDLIESIGENPVDPRELSVDAEGGYIVPGFVEIHMHGAMGADFSDGSYEGNIAMSEFLLRCGITSFLGTTMTLPLEHIAGLFEQARPLIDKEVDGRSVLRGIYMEGPFISKEKRGAQNEAFIQVPDIQVFRDLFEKSGHAIRIVVIAPETEGGMDFVREAGAICRVSIAHTTADYDTAMEAFRMGANHVTHLFNGMPPFHHREPGVVGAAADAGAFVELICDGHHLHPSVIRAAFRLYGDDKVCLVSDAMPACGMPDGNFDLGGQAVTVRNGAATIASGSLAGSVTVLTDCFRNAVRFGIPLESALKAVTINPSISAGLDHLVGSFAPGKRADILVLGKDLSLKTVILGGRRQLI